jgi:hypothetical protein
LIDLLHWNRWYLLLIGERNFYSLRLWTCWWCVCSYRFVLQCVWVPFQDFRRIVRLQLIILLQCYIILIRIENHSRQRW